MAVLDNICAPALIYLVFTLTQVIIDIYKKVYNIAITKAIQMVVFTLLLNILCKRGMTFLSWILVLIPFIFMSFMSGVILYAFALNDRESSVVDDTDCKDYGYDNSCQDGDCDDENHECSNDSDDDDNDNDDNDDNDNYIDDSLEEDGVEYTSTVYILPGQKAVRVDYDDMLVDKMYDTSSSSNEYVS
jgi:hypothetical protein